MPPVQSSTRHAAARGHRPAVTRRPARWWLAGLLVGCLLPTGLAQVENLRHAERIAQICILAPALIRASSRCRARRRALTRWPTMRGQVRCRQRLGRRPLPSPSRRPTASHDVLTRRGPPAAWAS
ncbi:hypothetical protein [Halomonas sp. C05BenzN]|uniref:hypothetical protein n=1 Tax=Halomonas sp. C05BenzN TaxID=3411041 RepID=UPI003B95FF54